LKFEQFSFSKNLTSNSECPLTAIHHVRLLHQSINGHARTLNTDYTVTLLIKGSNLIV